ncbi:MAG: hypothetical protein WAJ88_10855 [Pseudolabrys sp.]
MHSRPVTVRRQGARILIDRQNEVLSDGLEEIAGKTSQISGAVKGKRPIGGNWRVRRRRIRDLIQQI